VQSSSCSISWGDALGGSAELHAPQLRDQQGQRFDAGALLDHDALERIDLFGKLVLSSGGGHAIGTRCRCGSCYIYRPRAPEFRA